MVTSDEKTFALLSHVLAIFTGVLGPVVIYLIKKDESKYIGFHALQATLVQAVVAIVAVIGFILSIVTLGIGAILFVPLIMVASLGALVLHIVAAIKVNNGEDYRYPVIGDFAAQKIPGGYLPPNQNP